LGRTTTGSAEEKHGEDVFAQKSEDVFAHKTWKFWNEYLLRHLILDLIPHH